MHFQRWNHILGVTELNACLFLYQYHYLLILKKAVINKKYVSECQTVNRPQLCSVSVFYRQGKT